jgi:hypothetical protein
VNDPPDTRSELSGMVYNNSAIGYDARYSISWGPRTSEPALPK